MRLMIAIPTMDTVPVPFLESLTALVRRLDRDGVDYAISIENGTIVHMARERLACEAISKRFDNVLWLDSDMVFTDAIFDDLRFSGKPFVSGIAHGRRSPFQSCLFKSIVLDKIERWKLEEYPTRTFEVAGCGFACVLIETAILKAVMERYGSAFNPLPNYGEDLSFCKRATEMGYHIFAEPTVRLGHVGHLTIWPDDSERYRSELH